MSLKSIRLLEADEIEIRVGTVSEKGASLLLYKDARVDMNILDETYTPFGWQRSHEIIDGKYFCTVSIKDCETGEWIRKQDVGQESYADPIKGAASDSFKRACTNVGIGRELYTAPFIWLSAEKINIQEYKGKLTVKDKFKVSCISYDAKKRCITALEIVNQLGTVVFSMGKSVKRSSPVKEVRKRKITKTQCDKLVKTLYMNGISVEAVLSKHHLTSLEEMSQELYEKAMMSMSKEKGFVA